MMLFLHALIITSMQLTFTAGVSFLTLPTPRNTTLHSNVSFECATIERPPYWIINGTDRTSRWNSGITFVTQNRGEEYRSTLWIHATVANNNTQVQCGVLEMTSPPVLLLIQGKLHPPRNVRVNFTAYFQIGLIWEDPPTLDTIQGDNAALYTYTVIMVNLNTGHTERVVNTSRNAYTFIREDYIHCDTFSFQVAGINGAGIGYPSEETESPFLGSVIASSPVNVSKTTLSAAESATFHCSLLCDELNLVTWFINNKMATKFDPLIYRTRSNSGDCDSGALNYTETLEINIPSYATSGHNVSEVVTVYCSVLNGLTNKAEYERDRDITVCYSREAFLKVAISERVPSTSQPEVTTITATTSPWIPNNNAMRTTTAPDVEGGPQTFPGALESSETDWLLLGICIGLAITLILFILICIGALIHLITKHAIKGHRKTKSLEDPVYAIPFSSPIGQSDDNKSSPKRGMETAASILEAIYDQPKTPSPQPDMQPCAAYQTT